MRRPRDPRYLKN